MFSHYDIKEGSRWLEPLQSFFDVVGQRPGWPRAGTGVAAVTGGSFLGAGLRSGLFLHGRAGGIGLVGGLGVLLVLLGADTGLDLVAEVLVHVVPVLEGTLQDRLGHRVEQVAGDVADQPLAGRVVKDFADHRAGLAPVVILLVQGIGRAHHIPVGVPAGRRVAGAVGLRAALGVRRVHRVRHVDDAHGAVLAVAVHRYLR